MNWVDLKEDDRVVWATPTFVLVGTVLRRAGRSIKVKFDGRPKPTIIPDGRWYFSQGEQGNKREFLRIAEHSVNLDREVAPETGQGIEWAHPDQAEALFGVSQKTIRRWCREGQIIGDQDHLGYWRVDLVSLGRHLAERR